MAQNTESSRTGLRLYRTYHGDYPIRMYHESTASSFAEGHLVQLGTSTNAHRLIVASSNSTRYLGVAAGPASSDATAGIMAGQKAISVFEARADVEFIGWIKEVIASTLVGQYRGFARDSTRAIDYLGGSTAPANRRALITEVGGDSNISAQGPLASIGDTNGYVAFKFVPEFTEFDKPLRSAYVVEFTEPDLAASSWADSTYTVTGLSTANAVYTFTPRLNAASGYAITNVRCSTADELSIRWGNLGGSTISGSTNRGILLQHFINV